MISAIMVMDVAMSVGDLFGSLLAKDDESNQQFDVVDDPLDDDGYDDPTNAPGYLLTANPSLRAPFIPFIMTSNWVWTKTSA